MTSETRILVDITDIAGVEFKCKHCGAQILYPIEHLDTKRIVRICPNCNEEWFVYGGDAETNSFDLVRQFILGLKMLLTKESIKAQISWQVNCPKGASKSEGTK
jgi:DNA-directed RNA polymerase subunit RPC12/RpoP